MTDTFDLTLSGLDITVMLVYALGIIGYGLYSAKAKSSEEYFLAGRDMTWPIVGISLFAANISSSTLVGLAGDAFMTRTHVFNYEWLASVVLVFFAIFFLPFYLRSRVYTMPEFLERRYNTASRYYFSFITIIGNVLIDTAAGLFVGTVVLKLLFPDLSTFAIVSILAICSAAYTIPGGLNSVIQTEVVQAILLVVGSCMIAYFAFGQVADAESAIAGTQLGWWEALTHGLDRLGGEGLLPQPEGEYQPTNAEEVLSLVRPTGDTWGEFFLGTGGDGFMPWTGLLLGAPILGFYFWANNQFMVQRVLGAKDLNHGRWGALFAGLIKLPVLLIMVLPGTAAIMMFNGADISSANYQLPGGDICTDLAECPNATYPLLLFTLLPKGILGLVLAGLLAAMMSSVSATFNSASTLITMDFVKKLYPNLSSQQLVRVGQVATLVLVVLACLWAPQIERFGSLFAYLQIVLSFIAPPVAAAFVAGLFSRRVNGTGAFTSLLVGFAITIIFLVMVATGAENWFTQMHFLHRTFYLFVLCMLVNFIVSAFTEGKGTTITASASEGEDLDPTTAVYDTGDVDSPLVATTAAATGNRFLSFEDKVRDYTWNKSLIDEETAELEGLPWYQNYRYQSVILLVLTAILIAFFW